MFKRDRDFRPRSPLHTFEIMRFAGIQINQSVMSLGKKLQNLESVDKNSAPGSYFPRFGLSLFLQVLDRSVDVLTLSPSAGPQKCVGPSVVAPFVSSHGPGNCAELHRLLETVLATALPQVLTLPINALFLGG